MQIYRHLDWLCYYDWYKHTWDIDYRHYFIPLWITVLEEWSVEVVDVKRGLVVQLPLFTIA